MKLETDSTDWSANVAFALCEWVTLILFVSGVRARYFSTQLRTNTPAEKSMSSVALPRKYLPFKHGSALNAGKHRSHPPKLANIGINIKIRGNVHSDELTKKKKKKRKKELLSRPTCYFAGNMKYEVVVIKLARFRLDFSASWAATALSFRFQAEYFLRCCLRGTYREMDEEIK